MGLDRIAAVRTASQWLLTTILMVVLSAPIAMAHPPAQLSAEQEKGTIDEVKAFRKDVAVAIAARDGQRLRKFFADSFRHIHADGHIEGRDSYLAALLNGARGIDLSPATELEIRIPGGWTAIVTARTTLPAEADGKSRNIRWMAVYVRAGDSWQIVASHVTQLAEPKR